jgi:hypothetical protein
MNGVVEYPRFWGSQDGGLSPGIESRGRRFCGKRWFTVGCSATDVDDDDVVVIMMGICKHPVG